MSITSRKIVYFDYLSDVPTSPIEENQNCQLLRKPLIIFNRELLTEPIKEISNTNLCYQRNEQHRSELKKRHQACQPLSEVWSLTWLMPGEKCRSPLLMESIVIGTPAQLKSSLSYSAQQKS